MRIAYSWLQDYVTFDWSPDELADRLTMIGTAVERITPLYERFSGVKIARITHVERHPEKPHLTLCTLNTGEGDYVVVCGAPNVRIGQYSPYATAGAVLPGNVTVGTKEIGGITSPGFLCSEAELGLSEAASILMEFDEESAEAGADVWGFLHLDDWILDFELTPNRPDCMSALGLAREIAALTDAKIQRPDTAMVESSELMPTGDQIAVEVHDPEGCPRYSARIIDEITIGPSPFWLRRRLHSAGIRSINTIVDITNYVMLETGQPLHGFDLTRFKDARVVVRRAKYNEAFTALDGGQRQIPDSGVMITDGQVPVALGGIMGGLDSEVTDETKTVLLESAYFDPARIARTRKSVGLETESASRFEKGVDPNGTVYALERATALMAELAVGQITRGHVDAYPAPIEPRRLELRPGRANRLIGMELSSPQMINILSNLEFGVAGGRTIAVTVPTFRPDITREVDLIEEVARLADYELIPINRSAAGRIPTPENAGTQFDSFLRNTLVSAGLYEAITNSLTDPRRTPSASEEQFITLKNPLSEDLTILRPSLLSTLLPVVAHNVNRQVSSIRLFEVGRVFYQKNGKYDERKSLGVVLAGEAPVTRWADQPRALDFFDLKGVLVTVAGALGQEVTLQPGKYSGFSADLTFAVQIGDKSAGFAGLIDSRYARRFALDLPVWGAILEVDQLSRIAASGKTYQPVARFPKAERDCAFIVDDSVKAGELVSTMREAAGDIAETVEIFDIYKGKPIPPGRKSIAISLVYRAPDRTLGDDEVNAVQENAISTVKKKFNAELRDR